MSSTKKQREEVELSGPIALPTRTLLLMGLLFLVVAVTMLFFPDYWFTPITVNSCSQQKEIEKVWMSKSLTQCNEPWHLQNIPLEDYFESQGITIYSMKYGMTSGVTDVTCSACNCLSGNDLLIYVAQDDVMKLTDFTQL